MAKIQAFGICGLHMDVEPKIGGFYPPMDGENNGNTYEQMDDLGGFPIIFGNTHIWGDEDVISIYIIMVFSTNDHSNSIKFLKVK